MEQQPSKWKKWALRGGKVAFWFFLIKGILWLVAAALSIWFGIEIFSGDEGTN